ncbi:MAG: hypothetical protein M1812_007037 [Candelaria pacifica]|nr:MAG: hypothetical protein M1812_007037 [Candelaria pacifica]
MVIADPVFELPRRNKLMTLPPEIRRMIYRNLVDQQETISVWSASMTKGPKFENAQCPEILSVDAVGIKAATEATEVFYEENVFSVMPSCVEAFLLCPTLGHSNSPSVGSLIRRLVMSDQMFDEAEIDFYNWWRRVFLRLLPGLVSSNLKEVEIHFLVFDHQRTMSPAPLQLKDLGDIGRQYASLLMPVVWRLREQGNGTKVRVFYMLMDDNLNAIWDKCLDLGPFFSDAIKLVSSMTEALLCPVFESFEIRQEYYLGRLLYSSRDSDKKMNKSITMNEHLKFEPANAAFHGSLGLLQPSHVGSEIAEEACEIFYGQNSFVIDSDQLGELLYQDKPAFFHLAYLVLVFGSCNDLFFRAFSPARNLWVREPLSFLFRLKKLRQLQIRIIQEGHTPRRSAVFKEVLLQLTPIVRDLQGKGVAVDVFVQYVQHNEQQVTFEEVSFQDTDPFPKSSSAKKGFASNKGVSSSIE